MLPCLSEKAEIKARCRVRRIQEETIMLKWEKFKAAEDEKSSKERPYALRVEPNNKQNFAGQHAEGTPSYPVEPTGTPVLVGDIVKYLNLEMFKQGIFERRMGLIINHSCTSRDGINFNNVYEMLRLQEDALSHFLTFTVPVVGPIREEDVTFDLFRPHARTKASVVQSIQTRPLEDEDGTDQTCAYRVCLKPQTIYGNIFENCIKVERNGTPLQKQRLRSLEDDEDKHDDRHDEDDEHDEDDRYVGRRSRRGRNEDQESDNSEVEEDDIDEDVDEHVGAASGSRAACDKHASYKPAPKKPCLRGETDGGDSDGGGQKRKKRKIQPRHGGGGGGGGGSESFMSQLRDLTDLLERGILTKSAFEKCVDKLTSA